MLALILSLVGLGGIGAAAFAFPPFGALLLGFGKSALAFAAKLPWQVYAIAALAAVIAFLTISRGHFMDRAHADEARIANFCQVVRVADHNPKLDCTKAEAQVELMGQALTKVTDALNDQSARVRALAAETAQEQAAAKQASRKAEKAAQSADAIAGRLAASSLSTPAPGASCAPSKLLLSQWPS